MTLRLMMLAAIVMAPFAIAGSQLDPSIVDGTNDVDVQHGGAIAVGAPEIDLTAAWFNANATTLNVSLQVVDKSHRVQSDEAILNEVSFLCGSERVFVMIEEGPFQFAKWFKLHDSDGSSAGTGRTTWSLNGNTVQAEVPRSALACTTITQPLASTLIAYHFGNSWTSGPTTIRSGDVAPNSGYGRDYTMP